MLIRRVVVAMAILLMGASLVFTLSASAHNVGLAKAKEMAREYSLRVLNDQSKGYVQVIRRCSNAFSGHNHYVRCTIQYEDKQSKEIDGVFACTENIEVYFQSHRDGQNFQYYMKHTSRSCGSERLSGPNP
jgi:uncharacterized protein (DUF2147 family)